MSKPVVIAIDGPAASGKGTLAKRIARHFGFAHLDTGALYRAVGVAVLRNGGSLDDACLAEAIARTLDLSLLEDAIIRGGEAGHAASVVSAHPAVREALLSLQQNFAAQPPGGGPGAVLDGRDIGTVICPDATVKLFVTASVPVRARRRHAELAAQAGGSIPAIETVEADIRARDARDMNRATAPLRQAADAILLDTSDLDIEAAAARAIALVAGALRVRQTKPAP